MDQARYAELFRTEAREHLAELDATLLAFERHNEPADAATHVAALFRSTHTIKGMAAAMGYRAVEQLAHALESLLDGVRRGEPVPHETLMSLLFDGTDALRASIEEAVEGRGEELPAGLTPLLQRLSAAVETSVESTDVFPLPASAATVSRDLGAVAATAKDMSTDDRTVSIVLTPDCPLKGVRALLVLARLEAVGTVRGVDPAPTLWHADGFDGEFTVVLHSVLSAEAIEEAARAAGDVRRVTVRAVVAATRREVASEALRTVRVDRRRLDTLLDLVGELVITRDRLLRVAEESDQSSTRILTRTAHETARLISALQDEVLQARMVPVGQVFDRFPRLVRDIARDLGKDVHFVTEGREIELDRSLLDAIGDPIVHLLRNALDHGIEDAETRRAAGKEPTGRLTLRAARDRAAVLLQVEDDGRGIDRQVILRRAREQGLVTDNVDALDDEELLQVLAYAGFSTARAVTSVSGRGVGVDVVATRVRALGGVLEVETLKGQGTVFTLRLPITLAITRALMVEAAGDTYALPAGHVVEALEYDAEMLVPNAARESITLRDDVIPVVHLRERFGHPRREDDNFVVIVEVAGRRTALLVDSLVAQQDIVVKPIDTVRGSAPWFSGATVLGDGTPALIVDLGSLT